MQTQERDRISNSIINQLQIKDTVICNAISDNVNKAVLVNYDSIKLLSKTLKDKLKLLGFDSQHSIILNVISKALGYQNHHSMKKNFEKNPSVIEDIKTSMSDSILKRFFSIKDEFVSKFGIEKLKISNYPDKEYIFDFMYPKQSSTEQKNKIKEYLNSYGIKPIKNTIILTKIPHSKMLEISYQIVKQYRNFFIPIWEENDNTLMNYKHLDKDWSFISYANIKIEDNYLIVDSYSSDMPQHTINNFLDYLFSDGTLQDVEFFENCLNKTHNFSRYETLSLEHVARIFDWQDKNELDIIVKNKKEHIKETLESIDMVIPVMPYMHPLLKKIEKELKNQTNKKTLKDFIIENCEYFYNVKEKYSKHLIQEKLYIDLLKKDKKSYYEEMNNNKNEKLEIEYDITCRCIEQLSNTIYNLIDVYNEAEFTLPTYTKIRVKDFKNR